MLWCGCGGSLLMFIDDLESPAVFALVVGRSVPCANSSK